MVVCIVYYNLFDEIPNIKFNLGSNASGLFKKYYIYVPVR